ncbi:hypothetical protein [Marinoscillum furvescens]|uniref:Uncharacterized protein n=1 Tax=Marinoscillum furvescens DSM 4134 TaxID=1122208 RepID=A0A3D9KX34_MARFU|nr:hypothetical protein [Marinoscillum furvescens]RED91912.1 hypothetical protein C7460_13529 [Marinoscillum furvescens DSM 4134]
MKNNTIDAKLLSAQVALENALHNETIKTSLGEYGYDEPKLNEGLTLFNDAYTKHLDQKKEYGDQYAATDALDTAMDHANALYIRHVKIARIALRTDRGASATLELDGRRKQTYSGWLKQARLFYANALASTQILSALAHFGITTEKLEEGQAAVAQVETSLVQQLREKGEAQNATEARDEALDALMDWVADFIAIARIALEHKPQLLENLGIIQPSEA